MTTATKPARKRAQLFTRTTAEVLEQDLGDGICGRIRAAILTYSVVDTWGTVWKPGCLDKTRAKVAAGKVDFFVAADEGYHQYGTKTHIGIVRSIELSANGEQELALIDLFDTEEGRAYKDYVKKVMAARGNTGYSVGVYDRSMEATWITTDAGVRIYVFTEVELDEITGTARPAVPGTRPLAVRADEAVPDDVKLQVFDTLARSIGLDQARARLGALQGDATAQEDPPADEAAGKSDAQASRSGTPEFATEEARIRVLRLSYAE
jgi:hypothetical protein